MADRDPLIQIGARVPKSLKARLEALANSDNRSLQAQVILILEIGLQQVERREPRPPRRRPQAQALTRA